MTDTSTARPYTPDDKATMIKMVSGGASWDAIADKLGRGVEACQRASGRMRDAGEWPDVPDAVRELPRGPGRPRNRKPSAKVSPRLSTAVSSAVREVAKSNRVREGKVLNEAIRRYIETRYKRGNTTYLKQATLLHLEADAPRDLAAYPREETMSVSIKLAAFEALLPIAKKNDQAVSAEIADAVHDLLADLGFTFGDEDA